MLGGFELGNALAENAFEPGESRGLGVGLSFGIAECVAQGVYQGALGLDTHAAWVLRVGEPRQIFSSELLNPFEQGLFKFQQARVTGIEVGCLFDVIENAAERVAKK